MDTKKSLPFISILSFLVLLGFQVFSSQVYAQEVCDPLIPNCPDLPAFCDFDSTRGTQWTFQCTGGFCDDTVAPPTCIRSCNPQATDFLGCAPPPPGPATPTPIAPPPVVATPTPIAPPPVLPTLPPPPPGTFRIGAPAGFPVRQPAPFDKDTTIGNIITFAITILITIGIAASIIWLLYGAVKYITSGGDKAAIESAKTHIVSAIVGLIILVFTFVIINLVLSIFGAGTLSGTTFTIPDI